MNPIRLLQGGNGHNGVKHEILSASDVLHSEHPENQLPEIESDASARRVRYGLPCARCRTYYGSDMPACPVCRSTQRISAVTHIRNGQPWDQELPDSITLEQERERFLREFRSQHHGSAVIATDATASCRLEHNHHGERPAEVCRACYDRLQERLDLLEAALHIDLREAAQIVYEAVWADPTSNKTYHNAAQAILTELRKRAGLASHPFQLHVPG
jgi:hypothetical protein